MKKPIGIICLVLLTLVVAPTAAATIYVDDDGGDGVYLTIQAAIDAAIEGDTIYVFPGIYSWFPLLKQSLTITGAGADLVTVDMTGLSFEISGNKTTCEGLTIFKPSVMRVYGQDCIIRNSILNGITGSTAMFIETQASNCTFANNTIKNLTGATTGLDIKGGSVRIINNTFVNIPATNGALYIRSEATNAIIERNLFENCTGTRPLTFRSVGCTIANNTFKENTGDAMRIWGYKGPADNNIITGNSFGDTAIWFRDSGNGNRIYLNNNISGVVLYSGSPVPNTIYWNATEPFTYTYKGAEYTGYPGNFWSSYAGEDADGDGIIDTPNVLPSGLGTDYEPLVGAWSTGTILGWGGTPPTANFTADVISGIAPLTVQFTDESTGDGITDWAWDFQNDGTVDSTSQDPSYVYTAAGTYTVNLTVTNAGGNDSEVKADYITVTAAAPELTWGPYLTSTTTTGTTLNVKTDIPSNLTIEYATDSYFSANSVYEQTASDSLTTPLHHVALVDLAPDTLYHYRVLFDGQATGDFHFRTFPESGPVKFVMYSDTQDQLPTYSQLERHKLVADRIAEEDDVAFVLNSGDLVNNAADLPNWDRYFAAGSMMMANTTVYPALGNHDANNTNYYQNYGLPEYYSFDCGAAHVAVLDSNSWAWDNFPVQSAWLAGDLQTGKPFRFVSFHHPPYTSEQNHFGGYENIRSEWEDEFIQNDVTAVFNGHVHAYERLSANGITYFVSGTGGGPAYNLANPRTDTSQNSLEYALAYIRVTVDPSAGTATAEVIRVADVSSDLKNITTLYPPNTVFETVVMPLPGAPVVPVAAFTANPTTGTAPLMVNFTDQSTNTPTSWAWDVNNDGTVDYTTQNATHTYATAGTYTVNLTVTNAGGNDSEVKTDYITVTPQSPGEREVYLSPSSSPVANGMTTEYEIRVSSLPEGLAGYDLRVSLDNPSIAEITGVQYPVWAGLSNTTPSPPADSLRLSAVDIHQSIQAGAEDTLLATITFRADNTGTSAITLSNVNLDADGGDVIVPEVTTGEIVVHIPLVADFEANVTYGKASASKPLFVAFTDLSTGVPPGSLWSWDFDNNGVADSILQNPVTSYTNPGNYSVSLSVQNIYSSDTEIKSEYIRITRYVKPFPGQTNDPTDPDGDFLYEDINGNGRLDYDDIVMYYENMQWICDQSDVGIEPYDYNQNGRIDYDDVVVLYQELLARH